MLLLPEETKAATFTRIITSNTGQIVSKKVLPEGIDRTEAYRDRQLAKNPDQGILRVNITGKLLPPFSENASEDFGRVTQIVILAEAHARRCLGLVLSSDQVYDRVGRVTGGLEGGPGQEGAAAGGREAGVYSV